MCFLLGRRRRCYRQGLSGVIQPRKRIAARLRRVESWTAEMTTADGLRRYEVEWEKYVFVFVCVTALNVRRRLSAGS